MKKLFVNVNSKFQGNKDCSPVEGTLDIGTLFNNLIVITKRRIKTLLFNKIQFNVNNYINKCNTAYIELNPDFIQSLLSNQNNKFIEIKLFSDYSGTPIQQLVSVINDTGGFIVDVDENYIFTLTPDEQSNKFQFIFKLGKGTWGSLGVPVTVNNFIEIIQPSINTGNTDSPLANNGVLLQTTGLKTIAAYFEQLEFVNSLVEPNTSTLKLKDSFVQSILNNQNNKIKQFNIYNKQSFSNNIAQDLVNYMNTDTPLSLNQFEIGVIDFYDNNLNKAQFLFGPGKGTYGIGFTIANLGMLYKISSFNELDTLQIVTDRGNTTTNNLGLNVINPTAILHTDGNIIHENLTDANADNTFTKQLVSRLDGTIGTEDRINISSGEYTPNIIGVDANNIIVKKCSYIRIGRLVNVKVSFDVDNTSTSFAVNCIIDLPFNRLNNISDFVGNGVAEVSTTGLRIPVIVQLQQTNTATAIFKNNDISKLFVVVNFQYLIE